MKIRMTTNIDASIFINKFFNLESTGLSVIVFRFQEATFVYDGRVPWSLGNFTACLSIHSKFVIEKWLNRDHFLIDEKNLHDYRFCSKSIYDDTIG